MKLLRLLKAWWKLDPTGKVLLLTLARQMLVCREGKLPAQE